MHMAIILLPSDNYEHQHIIRATSVNDKTFRAAIAQLNPDIHILYTVADVTPEMVNAAADKIRENDPTHDPIHPTDLTTRDPEKVAAEQAAAATKATPQAHDAVAAAAKAHAEFRATRTPKPAAPPAHPAAPSTPPPKPA